MRQQRMTMKRSGVRVAWLGGCILAGMAGIACEVEGASAPTTPPPPATGPVNEDIVPPAKADEIVISFEKYDAGVAIPKVTEKGVTFALAWPPQQSAAQGRVDIFPHLYTGRQGLNNA